MFAKVLTSAIAIAIGYDVATAAVIDGSSIAPLTSAQNASQYGSGNGTLDLILFTNQTAQNTGGAFDGDDANTTLPTGGNTSATGWYITSIGDIRAFYAENFPSQTIGEMVLFVDVNETGGTNANSITLNDLQIVTGFAANFSPASDARNDPFNNDVASSKQNSTVDADITSGTNQSSLVGGPYSLPLVNQGGGHADVAIALGFNPFDPIYDSALDTRIAFRWSSSDHDNGGDTVYLSGSISPAQIVPEPAMFGLATLALIPLLRRRTR